MNYKIKKGFWDTAVENIIMTLLGIGGITLFVTFMMLMVYLIQGLYLIITGN